MYVVTGVDERFPFKPQVRKEISAIEWFPLDSLPKGSYGVEPFVPRLRRWMAKSKGVRAPKNPVTPGKHRVLALYLVSSVVGSYVLGAGGGVIRVVGIWLRSTGGWFTDTARLCLRHDPRRGTAWDVRGKWGSWCFQRYPVCSGGAPRHRRVH